MVKIIRNTEADNFRFSSLNVKDLMLPNGLEMGFGKSEEWK